MKYIWIYLGIINVIGFLIFAYDKYCAKCKKWRISETTLMGMAIMGGSLGIYLSMKIFRHKTKHMKFAVGVPSIFFIQVFLGMCYQYLI